MRRATEPWFDRRRPARGRLRAALGACLGAALSLTASAAQEGDGRRPVALWTDDAPLRAVLAHLLGADGTDVRFGDEVSGLIEGRLDGTLDDVLGELARAHELAYYRDADAIWVDRADRLVVRFLALDAGELEQASVLFESLPGTGEGNTVALSGRGVVVAGDRPFVQKTLARLEDLRASGGVGGAEEPGATAAPSSPPLATSPPVLSVTDIPGFDVDYANRAEYAPYMREASR